mgnify:CR=1 FL=1
MTEINEDDNTLKRMSNLLKKKGAIGSHNQKKPIEEGLAPKDLAELSSLSTGKVPPKNEIQKIAGWVDQLKKMEPDKSRVDDVKELLESGHYNQKEVMEDLLDALEDDLFQN